MWIREADIVLIAPCDFIDDRATFYWNSMNSSTCDVDQMIIRYREVGSTSWTNKWLGNPTGVDSHLSRVWVELKDNSRS